MNKLQKYYADLYHDACYNGNHKHYGVQYFYKTPSQEKIDIELSILKQMHEEHGYCYKVLCGNIFIFTCAYLMNDENHLWLKVFTKTKVYKILMED